MPEPITLALASVTVISVAVCAYKAVDRLVSAPKEILREGGDSVEGVIKTLSSELRRLFGSEPRISVNRRVVQTGGTAIRELALYKETILIKEEWANTTWKSTKTLQVEQPFVLKAGFDLNRLKIEIEKEQKKVTVTISESTIVSVEYAGDYEVLKEEHGFWNRITTAERDTILNSLPSKAQEEAEALKLREKAMAQLELFLRPMVSTGYNLVVKAEDDTISFKHHDLPSIPESALASLGLRETSEPQK